MSNYDDQIASLTRRVYHLEQEIIRLGGKPYSAQVQSNIMPESVEPKIEQSVSKDAQKKVPVKQKKDMENKIGKNVMAILASILIFFSLLLFAGIAFSFFSNTGKAIIMFVISIAIAVFGVLKMPKKGALEETKYGIFFTALAACGIGAIYITALVSYFAFNCIPLIPFIIILGVWIVGTMFLAYNRSSIFTYICNAGLVIATVLITLQFENSIVGFVIYTICLAALYMISRHKNYNLDCHYFIQYPIVFILLSSVVETNIYMYLIFAVMLVTVFVYANMVYKIETKNLPVNIITAILNIFAIIKISTAGDADLMAYVSIALLMLTMGVYFVRYYKTIPMLFYTIYAVTYIAVIGVFFTTDMYILVALVPFIAFIAIGFMLKDVVVRCGGYLALFVSFAIHVGYYSFWPVFIIYLVIAIMAIVFMITKSYSLIDKYVLTTIVITFISSIVTKDQLETCFVFIIFSIIALLMNTKYYLCNINTMEQETPSRIIGYIASGYMILYGLFSILSTNSYPELYQVILFSLGTLAVCLVNTKNIFEQNIPEILAGTYICLKFTVLIFAILHRLSVASFIISVVGILIAIICIILGFNLKHKSFRLYGLVVSLICVIKLILFDIKYDSFILRPVGFFVAGVLCFAISFIYSKLEKGANRNDSEHS